CPDHLGKGEKAAIVGYHQHETARQIGNAGSLQDCRHRLGLLVPPVERAAYQPLQILALGQQGVQTLQIFGDSVQSLPFIGELEERSRIAPGQTARRGIFACQSQLAPQIVKRSRLASRRTPMIGDHLNGLYPVGSAETRKKTAAESCCPNRASGRYHRVQVSASDRPAAIRCRKLFGGAAGSSRRFEKLFPGPVGAFAQGNAEKSPVMRRQADLMAVSQWRNRDESPLTSEACRRTLARGAPGIKARSSKLLSGTRASTRLFLAPIGCNSSQRFRLRDYPNPPELVFSFDEEGRCVRPLCRGKRLL